MKIAAPARLVLAVSVALLASACVYAPVMQRSFGFEQHPGVMVEVWQRYDAYGVGYASNTLVNRSGVDKCAWAEGQPSRLLRNGESWQVPAGNVGVSNVMQWDPNCADARNQR
jgi:hypothetical protein